jgi:hypothetical protein
VEVVVGFLVGGLVLAIAAFFVGREATRIARNPPPALFDPDDALDWVIRHLPVVVAATLTPDDARRILAFQVEYLAQTGVAVDDVASYPAATVVIGGPDTVGYVVDRCAATGEAYLPEQVEAVIETQLDYLRAIGAVGPRATDGSANGSIGGSTGGSTGGSAGGTRPETTPE